MTTVQPVGRRLSVKWPTSMPATRVMLPGSPAGDGACMAGDYGAGLPWPGALAIQSLLLRSRKALLITETELRLIASAAIMGDSSQPVNGYSRPAASGMPSAL